LERGNILGQSLAMNKSSSSADTRHFDVVIVGGAIIGSAVAYFLSRNAGFDGSVCVIERDPTYRTCSTALSVSAIREQFSTPANIQMSQFGIEFLRDIKGRFGAEADVGYHGAGYLLLFSDAGRSIAESNVAIQKEHGAETVLLDADALKRRFDWLNTDGVAGGTLGGMAEGWFDSHSLLQLMRNAAREAGVVYLADEATGLQRQGSRITAVETAQSGIIACDMFVNAAGPAAGAVAALAGIDLPVEPRRRLVFVFDCRTPPPPGPLLVDMSGVWCRPESGVYITGVSPGADEPDPGGFNFEVDHGYFDSHIWPHLATRIPAFEAIKVQNAWACHYDYNTLDQNAILGPHPEVGNYFFANGFSSHGLQQAPAVGRALSELIVDGHYRTLDLTCFGYDRIAANRPLREINVI